MGSGSKGENHNWSVFDGVKVIPTAPEALMAEINSAIASFEYAKASVELLNSPSSSQPSKINKSTNNSNSTSQYDAKMADAAYKSGLAALTTGKLDEAIHSLNTALTKCPPDKTSAVAKLQSLISFTSQQLQKSPG